MKTVKLVELHLEKQLKQTLTDYYDMSYHYLGECNINEDIKKEELFLFRKDRIYELFYLDKQIIYTENETIEILLVIERKNIKDRELLKTKIAEFRNAIVNDVVNMKYDTPKMLKS